MSKIFYDVFRAVKDGGRGSITSVVYVGGVKLCKVTSVGLAFFLFPFFLVFHILAIGILKNR